jgi:microcystin-dependent protein
MPTIRTRAYFESLLITGYIPTQDDYADLVVTFMSKGGSDDMSDNSIMGKLPAVPPAGLGVGASTVVGRKETGDITAISFADLATALGVSSVVGGIQMYGGAAAPSGWLICDGSAVNRIGAYATLFGIIGTTFGAGNGTTTFNLPNFTGRAPVGPDGTNLLAAPFGAATYNADHHHTQQGSVPVTNHAGDAPVSVVPTAQNTADTPITVPTVPPSLSINFIIKY